jgi:hypothetical protein
VDTPNIAWEAIFDRIRLWIDILMERYAQIMAWIAPYMKDKDADDGDGDETP